MWKQDAVGITETNAAGETAASYARRAPYWVEDTKPTNPTPDDGGGVNAGGVGGSTADAPALPGDGGTFHPGTPDAPIGVFPSSYDPYSARPVGDPITGPDFGGSPSSPLAPPSSPMDSAPSLVSPDSTNGYGTTSSGGGGTSGSGVSTTSATDAPATSSDSSKLLDLLNDLFRPQSAVQTAPSFAYEPMITSTDVTGSDNKGRNILILVLVLAAIAGGVWYYKRRKGAAPKVAE